MAILRRGAHENRGQDRAALACDPAL